MISSHALAAPAAFVLACSTVPAPEPQTQESPATQEAQASAAEVKHACGNAAACFDQGKKADEAKDAPLAKELYKAACDQGNGPACTRYGSLLGELDKDEAAQAAAWRKGCDLEDASGCFNLAETLRQTKPKEATPLYAKACNSAGKDEMLASLACGRGGVHAYESGDHKAAAELARASCTEDRVAGCNLLAVMTLKGQGGIAADPELAQNLFQRACKEGDASACDNEKKLSNALDVPGANITMGSVTADGFTLNDVQCKAEGGGGLGALLLGPAVAGALSKKKGALDACAPKGADARVRWTAKGGKITAAEAKAGDAKIEACIMKVVKTAPAVLEGTCAATIHVGK